MKKWSVGMVAVGLCSFLGVTMLTDSSSASAAYRRLHSSICHYYYDNAGTTLYNGAYLSASTNGRAIYCPAVSDSELPHASVTTLNVHGYSPSARSNYSRACNKAYNSSALSCGPIKYWSAGYTGVYGVDVGVWNANGAGMPMVLNYIAPNGRLYGFYMKN